MSFEGYWQVICENRHSYNVDVIYDRIADPEKDNEFVCPDCGAHPVWVNCVDDTNCDEHGLIELETDQPEHMVDGELQPETVVLPQPDSDRNEQWFNEDKTEVTND